ncbi:MAG: sodium:calcium antiporter [FCB group bacterium]|nr:sodium:calcium antiporter [FCB group bacterium]
MTDKSSTSTLRITIMIIAILLTLPGILVKLGIIQNGYGAEALLFGLGLLGAALMLSWAAEVSQMDISQGFALAILAFIAVLPEYAVDMVFAWKAAGDPQMAHFALANMTGANRLLIGLGWPMVLIIFFIKTKKKSLALSKEHSTEIFYLICATVYAFSIPFKSSLNLIDAAILVAIFVTYIIRTARAEVEEPELVGPAAMIGSFSTGVRRTWVALLFLYSGFIIFISAEPFAHSLVEFGREAGIDQFLLVQWVAPLASEAPEFIVAGIWASRLQAQAAMGALISSKVNQWTLLVGTLPVVYSIASGKVSALPLDMKQDHEIWLTAGQSIFAVAILCNLKISWYGAIMLVVLFMAQLIFSEIRMEVMWIYLLFAAVILLRERKHLPGLAKIGLKFK